MMKNHYAVRRLGECKIKSPLDSSFFIDENDGVLIDATIKGCRNCNGKPPCLEEAGPRRKIFFNASGCRAAVVTCGGLCPGLNDVIRALTMILWYRYSVKDILGLRYGYEGLVSSFGHQPVVLTPDIVEDIHQKGGTILGSSRGPQDIGKMVDFLQENRINMLFTIGGDGTQKGALEIVKEIEKRKLPVSVCGIPKTVDNDISLTDRTFGFETAVAMTRLPISAAHMEAKGVPNGVGLVKLMGRESGFVASYATLASSDVNLVLIPEVPFHPDKVCSWLEKRIARKAHAVIVVAEGAGQEFVLEKGRDVSGNRKLGDIGLFLKKTITSYFKERKKEVNVKYIDPSYTIRSAPASADDSVFCFRLAENAVHASISGRTGLVISLVNGHFAHVPMELAVSKRKKIDATGSFWQSVLDNTGQPPVLV